MLAAVAVAGIGGAEAKVLRIVVERTEALAASVGAAALEKLRGRAYGEFDPGNPANAVIVDLKLAPRNANGKVEYVSVFELTSPSTWCGRAAFSGTTSSTAARPSPLARGRFGPPA
jgi:hypothetical protein